MPPWPRDACRQRMHLLRAVGDWPRMCEPPKLRGTNCLTPTMEPLHETKRRKEGVLRVCTVVRMHRRCAAWQIFLLYCTTVLYSAIPPPEYTILYLPNAVLELLSRGQPPNKLFLYRNPDATSWYYYPKENISKKGTSFYAPIHLAPMAVASFLGQATTKTWNLIPPKIHPTPPSHILKSSVSRSSSRIDVSKVVSQ